MKRKMRERLVALVCVMSMLCAVCLNGMPALAGDGDSTATDITLENAPERFFSQWTFSDLGIEKQTVTDSGLNWDAAYSGGSLDKTIFAGKINFKDNLSNLYIGGGAYWNGFLIQADGTDGLVLSWSGSTDNTVIEFDYTTAKVSSLRNNSDLTVAFSFEYIHERVVNGVPYVDVNLGVFFNGNLYANTYYTFENIQKDLLKQDFRIYNNGNCGYDIESVALTDITFADAPESAFDAWSFSDLGIEDQNVTSNLNMAYTNPPYPAISSSLDKTVFRAKVNFSSSGMTAGGPTLFIGSGTDSDWRGLQLWAYGASVLALRYQYDDATVVMPVQFNSTTAEVNLFDNDVELAISIEYRNVRETEDGTFVDMRVGVFFGGKLYDNKYYTFADIPEEQLMQIAKMSVSGHSVAISSYPEKTITLDNAPERFFDEWTFKDAGVDNGDVNGGSLNWNATTSSQDLDRTIFHGKINFKDTLSNLYIGGNETWYGFCIQADGTNGLKITHQTSGQTVGTYNDTIAKTTLRNNSNLELSLSVEYLEETVVDDVECVNVKVGVFFDGVLYDNKYSEIKNVPKDKMRRNVKLYQGGNYYFASDYLSDITLANAPEAEFDYWTFSDFGIANGPLTTGNINWTDNTIDYPSIGASLDHTIFHTKVHFPTTDFGFLTIGGMDDNEVNETESHKYRGFQIYPNDTTGLILKYQYSNSSAPTIATFDAATAETALRGEDVQLSLSVEYLDIDDSGNVTMKVGVFFNGKLYDNKYYIVEQAGITEDQLTQIVRYRYNSNGVPIITSVEKSINVASECNGGTVIVSHIDQRAENDGYGMSNLIDTVTSPKETYYRGVTDSSLENETMTFEFRFDDVYSVDMVQMVGRTSVGGFPKNFSVSAYTADGWKDVLSQTDYEMTNEQNKFMFDAVDCTAVRLTTTGDGVCLSEFEAYGVPSNADVTKPQSFTQNATPLSIGKNSIAITDGIYTGNDGYRALEESATHKVDVQLIFQQMLQADGVTFYSQEAGEFPSAFDIYAFTGSTWEKVYSATDYQPNESRIMHQFNFEQAVSCSSMILVVNELYDLYGSYGMQLQEVCVNAVEGTSSISLLGDGNTDGMLTEADDMQALRQAAVGKVEATSAYDINNDAACSSFDLIRMKRYFATEPTLTKQHDITSMSFNVLGVSAQSGMQDPTVRAPKIAEYILEQDLDLVGLQEAGYQGYHVLNKPDGYDSYEDYNWTTNFADLICEGGYAAIKISDDPTFKSQSEHYNSTVYGGGNVPISAGLMMFYKTSRFDLIESGAQQYISTESQERWFQWAKLLDKQSGEIVYMTNTHWSIDLDADGNASETAGDEHRTKQSNELLAFWKNTVGDNLLVATGDYNCASSSEWLQSLGSDVYKEAGSSLEVLDAIGSHIDHIFVNANQATVETCHFKYDEFVLDGTSCRYSDHYPMFVRTSYISD